MRSLKCVSAGRISLLGVPGYALANVQPAFTAPCAMASFPERKCLVTGGGDVGTAVVCFTSAIDGSLPLSSIRTTLLPEVKENARGRPTIRPSPRAPLYLIMQEKGRATASGRIE